MNDLRRAYRAAGVAMVVAVASSCGQLGSDIKGLACDPTLEATGNAFEAAMTSLVTVAGTMRGSMAVACAAIATDLGMTPPSVGDGSMVSDDDMKQACDMAATAIKAAGKSTPIIEGGGCHVDATAQFSCESQCDVNGMCSAPDIVARCSPADLSGVCSGSCEAMAVCEGSASVQANCQGTCAASCTGTCTNGDCAGTCDGANSAGPCPGMCQGECAGSCKGTCTGDCTLDATAMVNCGAEATCRGGCSVAYTAPVCEAALVPPTCTIDANCEAACSGQASLQATCTAPTVSFVTAGSPSLKTTLTTNLPAILNVIAQGKLVAEAAANISQAAQTLSTQLSNDAACAAAFGVDFATQVTASVQATTTITVSVQASVSVSGSVLGT